MSLASQRSQAALYMQRWQMTADVDFHTLYLESLFSKGMHASLARIGWEFSSRKVIKHSEECSSKDDMENGIGAAPVRVLPPRVTEAV